MGAGGAKEIYCTEPIVRGFRMPETRVFAPKPGQRYAGIGSRETPEEIQLLQRDLGEALARLGCVLHSGHAGGSDLAFEEGALRVPGARMKIFKPWASFNGPLPADDPRYIDASLASNRLEAEKIAQRFHPSWGRLGRGGQLLQMRNSYQVLDEDLASPVDFVVCWTSDGTRDRLRGGTGQAARIALFHDVPIWNLKRLDDREAIQAFIAAQVKNRATPRVRRLFQRAAGG